jgi:16S rRNA A1518/A1519 N6-dimethyltransferase RsmA/KsgA/DIM1 with predicted DNA glycosylase/AP lyase activity
MLVDRRILDEIISAASVSEDEVVLEMGTGQGILTAELSKRAKQVISYEVDVNYSEASNWIFSRSLIMCN